MGESLIFRRRIEEARIEVDRKQWVATSTPCLIEGAREAHARLPMRRHGPPSFRRRPAFPGLDRAPRFLEVRDGPADERLGTGSVAHTRRIARLLARWIQIVDPTK